jgi:hypothetical protein
MIFFDSHWNYRPGLVAACFLLIMMRKKTTGMVG